MDEPSATLDIESESIIFNNIFEQTANGSGTDDCVQWSILRKMDKIIVIEKGKISEIGSHIELINKGGAYSHWYKIQKQRM